MTGDEAAPRVYLMARACACGARPSLGRFSFEPQERGPPLMHAALDETRQLARRLSMLSTLQQETIKLERRQLAERRAGREMVNQRDVAEDGVRGHINH